jgi:putative oxidoreductase
MNLNIALLIIRIVVGFLLVGHGTQKLFGWFGGKGFSASAQGMGAAMRLRPARFWTLAAGLSEAGGGLLFALGLFSPLGALGISAAMITASLLAHWGKLWNSNRGMELPLTYLTTAIAIGLVGPGAYSADALLGVNFQSPETFLYGMVAVLVGVIAVMVTRPPAPTPVAEAQPRNEAGQRPTARV